MASDQVVEIAIGVGGPDLFNDHGGEVKKTCPHAKAKLGKALRGHQGRPFHQAHDWAITPQNDVGTAKSSNLTQWVCSFGIAHWIQSIT